MAITVLPITPDFVAEVGDVDLAAPLSVADFEDICEAFWRYAVLVFPDQALTQAQHMAFAERFGPLEPGSASDRQDTQHRIAPQLTDISNLEPGDALWDERSRRRMFYMGNRLWHTDASFRHKPGRASLLYARSIAPLGGHTEFADQRAAFDALPRSTQERLLPLVAEHSIFHSRKRIGFEDFSAEDYERLPPVHQVLVRTLPESGRKSLYLASHAGRIVGMPDAEGLALIDELIAHTTQRQFVYTHRWRLHDLVMWDNRCTMHRGTDFDDLRHKRDMHRATVVETVNSCEQAGISAA